MHVVVVGCGRVGSGLARTLEDMGHSVAVIDQSQKAFARLPEGFGGRTVVGVGFDRDHLAQAGIDEAGALAAVTSGDNSNIMIARIAREVFGVERVLHRIVPDVAAAEWTDPSANLVLVERPVADSWAGRRLADLDVPGLARVAALSRLGVGQVPEPDLVTQEGDVVYMTVQQSRVAELDAHLTGSNGAHP